LGQVLPQIDAAAAPTGLQQKAVSAAYDGKGGHVVV